MARQITELAVDSFMADRNFNQSNTRVSANAEGTYMYLFGNLIAQKCGDRISVTLAGWNSSTTKERLRGLGANITSKNGKPYITIKGQTMLMDSYEFYKIN